MKIFTEGSGSFAHKVNFVDSANNSVGYDLATDCCEDADWFILDNALSTIDYDSYEEFKKNKKLNKEEVYRFDTPYIKEVRNVLDDGGMVVFKLTALGLDDKYLHLVNSHNGYYCHSISYEFQRTITI